MTFLSGFRLNLKEYVKFIFSTKDEFNVLRFNAFLRFYEVKMKQSFGKHATKNK